MNEQSRFLLDALAHHCPSMAKRPELVSVATATVLSRMLDLPAQRMDAVDGFLNANCKPTISRGISAINAHSVLNINLTTRLTLALWKIRYDTAYPPSMTQLKKTEGFIDTYVGAGNSLPSDLHCMIQPYQDGVLALAPYIENLIKASL